MRRVSDDPPQPRVCPQLNRALRSIGKMVSQEPSSLTAEMVQQVSGKKKSTVRKLFKGSTYKKLWKKSGLSSSGLSDAGSATPKTSNSNRIFRLSFNSVRSAPSFDDQSGIIKLAASESAVVSKELEAKPREHPGELGGLKPAALGPQPLLKPDVSVEGSAVETLVAEVPERNTLKPDDVGAGLETESIPEEEALSAAEVNSTTALGKVPLGETSDTFVAKHATPSLDNQPAAVPSNEGAVSGQIK